MAKIGKKIVMDWDDAVICFEIYPIDKSKNIEKQFIGNAILEGIIGSKKSIVYDITEETGEMILVNRREEQLYGEDLKYIIDYGFE